MDARVLLPRRLNGRRDRIYVSAPSAAPRYGCTTSSRGIGGCEGPPCISCLVSTRDAMRRDATRSRPERGLELLLRLFFRSALKSFLRSTNESLARLAFQTHLSEILPRREKKLREYSKDFASAKCSQMIDLSIFRSNAIESDTHRFYASLCYIN